MRSPSADDAQWRKPALCSAVLTCCHHLASLIVHILVLSLTVLILVHSLMMEILSAHSHGADYCALSDCADLF